MTYLNSEIIEKIKKCFELSNSSNKNEAAVALKQAQKLMSLYNISHLDIEKSKIKINEYHLNKRVKIWEAQLTAKVAQMFYCEVVYIQTPKMTYALFVGNSINTDLAQYTLDSLLTFAKYDRKKFLRSIKNYGYSPSRKTKLADDYLFAWVGSAFQNIEVTPITSEDTNLFLQALYDQRKIETRTSFGREHKVNAFATAKGREDGSKISVRNAVPKGNQALIA